MTTYTAVFKAYADFTSGIAEGKKLGKSFADAGKEAKGTGQASQRMAALVASSTNKVVLATRNAEGAVRRVHLAELNLEQVRKRSKVTELQLATAEDRLTSARTRAKTANERLARSQANLEAVQAGSRAGGKNLFANTIASADRLGKSLTLGVTAPLTVLGVTAGRTFAEFEKLIVSAGSKSDATAAQIEQMKKVALDTAAETKFSATEAAEGLDILAAAGFNARDAIATLPAVTKAAQAQNADLGLTAEVTAKAMNAFNIPVERAAHVADVFTQAANTTTLDMQQLKDALGQVGEVGPRYNQSLEDVVAVTGRLADLGVPAASAGTAIRQALTSIAAPTDKAAGLMDYFGVEARGANGALKPLPDLIEEVKTKLDAQNPALKDAAKLQNLSQKELVAWGKEHNLTRAQVVRLRNSVEDGGLAMKDYAFRTLFGVEGAKAFALAMSDGKPVIVSVSKEQAKLASITKGLSRTMGVDAADAFVKAHISGDEFKATSTDAIKVVAALGRESDGTADRVAALFQKTTAQKAENFKGSLEALAITVFDRVSPALNDLLGDLTDFVSEVTELSRVSPTLTRLAVAFGIVLAAIGPVLFLGGKFVGVLRTVKSVTGVASKALETAGFYMELYGEKAERSGKRVRGGFLTNLGKVTGFLGGPWGAALAIGATVIGGFVSAQKAAKEETQAFADALEYQNGKLAENSRQTLAKQLADEDVLQTVTDAGVGVDAFTDALINGGTAREDMLRNLRQIQAEGTKYVQVGYQTTLQVTDQAKAAGDAAAQLEKYGVSLDLGAKRSEQAATAAGNAADATGAVGSAAADAVPSIDDLDHSTDSVLVRYQKLNEQLAKTADNFSILRDDAIAQQRANDAYKDSLDGVTASVKANRDALQQKVDKGKLSEEDAKRQSRALEGNTSAARANRAAITEQIEKLNDKVTADYKSAAASGDYVGAQKKARKETKAGIEELVKHARKAGLDEDQVRQLIKRLVKVPKEIHTDITFSTNAGKVLVSLKNSDAAKKAKANTEDVGKKNENGLTSPGLKTGGRIVGAVRRALGGRVPRRTGAGGPQQDLVMGINRDTGRHEVDISPEEYVVNARQTNRNLAAVETINAGGEWDVVPRRAKGGPAGDVPPAVQEVAPSATAFAKREARIAAERYARSMQKQLQARLDDASNGPIGDGSYASALKFARSQVGKPYIFGSAGPRGYDCSGFMAAIQNVIEGKAIYHRRYSTPAFHGAKAMGFTRGKKSPFMVGVNPAPGKSGHMAGTLNGVNVESAGGVGVRVGGSARGYNAGMFSWRGGLASGGRVAVPGRGGDLPYDTLSPSGQRYDPVLREVVRKMYGARAYERGTPKSGHLTLAGERGAELLRTRTGSEVMTSAKTLDYLSRIEALAVKAPVNLAGMARDAALNGASSTNDAIGREGDVNIPMTFHYVPESKLPTIEAQRQIINAGRTAAGVRRRSRGSR